MAITINQLNCHHSKAAANNLLNTIMKRNSIGLIQEPYQYNNRLINTSNLQTLKTKRNARTALIASPDLDIWYAQEFSSRDVTTAILRQNNVETFFASVYCDINYDTVIPNELKLLVNFCNRKNCLLYTSPSPRDLSTSRMPSSA